LGFKLPGKIHHIIGGINKALDIGIGGVLVQEPFGSQFDFRKSIKMYLLTPPFIV